MKIVGRKNSHEIVPSQHSFRNTGALLDVHIDIRHMPHAEIMLVIRVYTTGPVVRGALNNT